MADWWQQLQDVGASPPPPPPQRQSPYIGAADEGVPVSLPDSVSYIPPLETSELPPKAQPKSSMQEYKDFLRDQGIDYWRKYGDARLGSEALFASGAHDVSSLEDVPSGIGKMAIGAAGYVGSPLTAATQKLVEEPAASIGGEDVGRRAGLVAGLPFGGEASLAKLGIAGAWTPARIAQLRTLNAQGKSLGEIADEIGVSKPMISRMMKREDIDPQYGGSGRPWDEEQAQRLRDMQSQGMTRTEMARELGVSNARITQKLDAMRIRDNPDSAEGLGETPTLSQWETLPDGTMVRRSISGNR